MYKDRNTGVRLFQLPAIDFSVIIAMFVLVAMAWGVARLERTFERTEKYIPEFTVSGEISVKPVIEPKTKKEALKVGEFMSLAKSSARVHLGNQVQAKAEAAEKIVLTESVPTGAMVTPPKILYKSMPDYPARAIETGAEGIVMIKVFILKNGRVSRAEVDQTSGHEMLDRSALAAVSQWVFEPATYAREVSEAWFKVPVRFRLKS